MLPISQWFDANREDKDGYYANLMIRWIRMQMQPLVNVENARVGMDYLLGRQDLSAIKNLFQNPAALNLTNLPVDPILRKGMLVDRNNQPVSTSPGGQMQEEMSDVEFKPLPILEKARNILIAEMKKMGPVVNCRATDPTSNVSRKNDETLIKHGHKISKFLSYIYQSIGQGDVDMHNYADKFGDKPDSGNTKDFHAMGLNPQDPDDVAFFMNNFHKLDWEIEMQKVIDNVMSFNEVGEQKIEMFVNDIIAKKAIAAQIYVSDITGQQMYNYLTPETTYIYGGGRRKDYNDANAKAYQQLITIKEMLDRVGASFNWQENVQKIIMSVFTASSGAIDITAINPDWRGYGSNEWFVRGKNDTTYSFNQFMQFKVLFGYMEWVATDETEYGASVSNESTEPTVKRGKYDTKKIQKDLGLSNNMATSWQNNQNANGEKYPTKARYECPTYKAYYLCLTAVDHIMFDFGRVTYQDIEGYNDFNVNFSIITYKEIGDPIAILAVPMIDLIMECWYKYKYEIRRAKPRGMMYNYDSLIAIARNLYSDTQLTDSEKFDKILSWRDRSANGVWTFPVINGQPVVMSSNQLDYEIANGLSPEIMRYWEIMTSTWDKMVDMIMGTADLRQGDSAGDRSSMNNEFKALEYSQNSTYYLPDMVTFMCRQLATRTGMITQDIIQYKDYDTLAYKALATMVGEEALDKIEDMGKTAMHRYGIFVESLNQSAQRAKLSARIDFAIQNGKITNAQALLVENIKSPNLAFRTLAYFEQRTEKQKQQQQQQLMQQQQQGQLALEQMKQKTELMKIQGELQKANIVATGGLQKQIISEQGGMTRVAMKHSADVEQTYHDAMAQNMAEQANVDQTGKPTTPPPPPVPIQQQQGPSPLPQKPQSAIQQQMQQTQPSPTGP